MAGDWPQWRGPARDGHPDVQDHLPRSLAQEPTVVWRIPAGPGLASPVVVGNTVFLFDAQEGKETLRAHSLDRAQESWRVVIDDPFTDSQGPTGPRCTPVADGDRIYAVSCRGELQCRARADGKRLWHLNYSSDFGAVFVGEKGNSQGASRHGNNGTPLIDGDRLIACAGSTNGAGIVALNKHSGAVIWKSQNEVAGYAPPLVATLAGIRQYICYTAEAALGLESESGRLLWRFPLKTAFGRHAATPLIDHDRVILSAHQAGMIALDIRNQGSNQIAVPAWTNPEVDMNFSSPVQCGTTIYGLGTSRNLVAVDAVQGAIQWSRDGWFTTPKDKAYAGFLTDGRTLLILTDGGVLGLLATDDPAGKELGRLQVAGSHWCNPAWSNGMLVLRDSKSWICLNLGH
jgi:outer membrane protein assembly factor BamB